MGRVIDTDKASFGGDPYWSASKYPGSTGGSKIQAAIDALTTKGGPVYVNQLGPDDGIQNGHGKTEDNAWAVGQTLTDNGEHGFHLKGAAEGWGDQRTGTALIATADPGHMVDISGGYLSSVEKIRVDGGPYFPHGIRCNAPDVHIRRTMIQHCNQGVNTGTNTWLNENWIEKCQDAGIRVAGGRDVWITNHLSFGNESALRISVDPDRVWAHNFRSSRETRNAIEIGGAAVRPGWFSNIMIKTAGTDAVGTYDGIHFNGGAQDYTFQNVIVNGDDNGTNTTRHGINRASGTLTDCTFRNIRAYNITGSVLNNIVGSANGVRTVVNGHAWNSGNPSTTGDWNTHAERAVERGVHTVWDDSVSPPTAYTPYATGSASGWRAKNYTAA